jgi:hypothetical protein
VEFTLFEKDLLFEQLLYGRPGYHGEVALEAGDTNYRKTNSYPDPGAPNAEIRTREYLMGAEVESLTDARAVLQDGLIAGGGRCPRPFLRSGQRSGGR